MRAATRKAPTVVRRSVKEDQRGKPRRAHDVQITAVPTNYLQRSSRCTCGGGCPRCDTAQAKLKVNQPGDRYEMEADRVAEQVMRMPEPDMQRHEDEEKEEDEDLLQAKPSVQRRMNGGVGGRDTPPIVHEVLQSPGQPLDLSTRQFMEPRFGHGFNDVRVHTDTRAAESAQALRAQAYTVGNDIVFGASHYRPGTITGQRLLAHELTHVVQQGVGVPSNQRARSNMIQRQSSSVVSTFENVAEAFASVPIVGKLGPVLVSSVKSHLKSQARKYRARKIDRQTAIEIMGVILGIISSDPRRQKSPDQIRFGGEKPTWWDEYLPLLTLWYRIAHGESRDGERELLKGERLSRLLHPALMMTEPIVKKLESRRGGSWKRVLKERYHPFVAEWKERAKPEEPVDISGTFYVVPGVSRPVPVSVEEFFQVASRQDSKIVEIRRVGGFSLGNARVGDIFDVSKKKSRQLLWSNGYGVFFIERPGRRIYKQRLTDFSEDVILGQIIKAAQNALGSAIMGMIMTEILMSFMPFGILVDIAEAGVSVAQGDWKGAALAVAPGGALVAGKKAAKTRLATRVLQSQVVTAVKSGGQSAVAFIGRGAYRLKSKLGRGAKAQEKATRGIWLVTEAGEAGKSYRFFDEATGKWHRIDPEEATGFIKCSKCDFTPGGRGIAGAVDPLTDAIRRGLISADDVNRMREIMEGLRTVIPGRAGRNSTIAVAFAKVEGKPRFLFATNRNKFSGTRGGRIGTVLNAQADELRVTRVMAEPRVRTKGRQEAAAAARPEDAEQLLIEFQNANADVEIIAIIPSRPACAACASLIPQEGILLIPFE